MPATKIRNLLPIPEGVKQPHAYQVFGLEGGEQDAVKVEEAIRQTVVRLNEVKADSDPKVWKLAAKLVQQATEILNNPQKRSDLDARFGVVSVPVERYEVDTQVMGVSSSSNLDPLSAVLPSADPLAGLLPAQNSSETNLASVAPTTYVQPSAAVVPQAPSTIPSAKPQSKPPPASAVPLTAETADHFAAIGSPVSTPAAPKISVAGKSTRRRRSGANWILMFFVLGLLTVIGLLGYFLFYGPGELSITSSDGSFTIRTGSATAVDDDRNLVGRNSPRSRPTGSKRILDEPSRRSDGRYGSTEDRPPLRPPNDNGEVPLIDPIKAASDFVDTPMNDDSMKIESPSMNEETSPTEVDPPQAKSPAESDPEDSPEMVTSAEPQQDDNEATPNSEMMTVDGPSESGQTEMNDEMVAATDAKIDELKDMIRVADWKQMKPAADSLSEALMTDQQRQQVDTLYELADLATYYRGAIERGIYGRKAAESFFVADQLQIVVVGVEPEKFTIRYNGRNKSFSFDELPITLAHRMAEFALPQDKATNLAAKACYQAITPKSSDDYRIEAIDWLISTDGDVAGAHPKNVANMIKSIYGSK